MESGVAAQVWLFTSTTCESCDPVAINRHLNWDKDHDSSSQKFGFVSKEHLDPEIKFWPQNHLPKE